MRCNRCHRPMEGTTAYDGACACGGLIELGLIEAEPPDDAVVREQDGPVFGMYSEAGNDAVGGMVEKIVAEAREKGWTAERTCDIAVGCLDEMADVPETGEAYDTVVREAVCDLIRLELSDEGRRA